MRLTRRDFLKGSLGASTLLTFSAAVPGFLTRTAHAAAQRNNRHPILVVLQLSGGNDGLNTVIPYEDDAYHRARPTLRIAADRVLKLDSGLGLHPDMPGFLRLYHDGCLAILQGVGYPNSKRDHDAAQRDWHTARPNDAFSQTGWLGRAIDGVYDSSRADLPGAFVGHIEPPFSLQTEKALVPAIRSLDQWLLPAQSGSSDAVSQSPLTAPAKPSKPSPDQPLLGFLQQATLEARASSGRVQAVLQDRNPTGHYPQYPLADTLRSIAQLIRADLGIRIYFAELGGGGIGGFDTHAGQAANHGALLRELSESVAAWIEDLRQDKLLDAVLLMTFSEFGRSLSENGRRGTGHGAAAPIFLAGGGLETRLVGRHPSLTDLQDDAPKFHTDFRRVYATVLDRWLGFDSLAILGDRFEPLPGLIS